ncbi:hypothetical protein Tco_0542242 [Tanacetum coccineum]
MKWRGGSGGCDDDVDGGVGVAVTGGGEGGDGVGLVAVTNMVVVAAVEASEIVDQIDRVAGRVSELGRKTRRKSGGAGILARKVFRRRLAGNGREEGRVCVYKYEK